MSARAILTVNAGSSSIKFSIYASDSDPLELARGQVSAIGEDAQLSMRFEGGKTVRKPVAAPDHAAALDEILLACATVLNGRIVEGVGHRVVHGGVHFDRPVKLTDDVLQTLAGLQSLAPLHQPHNLAGIAAARIAFPLAVQVACFDTAFHRNQPWVNDTFALPRRFFEQGVRRYGFHGLSYDYVSGQLRDIAPDLALGRTVIAHLGNGASMCALRDGRSVGSTMGFSALDGLAMGTRSGQIDPGVLLYLIETEGMDAPALSDLLYRQSGLLGLSGISNDMRELEASDHQHAAEAIEYFVFRIRRELGALAAVLGGLDGLVFCGGIGENSSAIRRKVCANMDWLGIAVDANANVSNALDIGAGPVRVMVIPTDEERVIARSTAATIAGAAALAE